MDADSSQTVVIAEASGGRSLVVKGPPGTGKSQTITNIIAAAAAAGKKVLFVAEKMAALDVVHRRLRQVGLGPLALELHSNKVSKRTVLDELRRTRDGQLRPAQSDLTVIDKLGRTSTVLNDFAYRLHGPLQPSGMTPHSILGRLARAQGSGAPAAFALEGAETWDREAVSERGAVVDDVAERQKALGAVTDHLWRGVRRDALDPVERAALGERIGHLADAQARAWRNALIAEERLGIQFAQTVGGLSEALAILSVVPLPAATDRSQLTHPAWSNLEALARLVAAGREFTRADAVVRELFNDAGRGADLTAIRTAVVTKGGSLFRFLDGGYRAQIALLKSYLKSPLPKSQAERIKLDRCRDRREDRWCGVHGAGATWRGVRRRVEGRGIRLGCARRHRSLARGMRRPARGHLAGSGDDRVPRRDRSRPQCAGRGAARVREATERPHRRAGPRSRFEPSASIIRATYHSRCWPTGSPAGLATSKG